MSENNGRELGWEDEIENDSADFVLLPEGEYAFQVMSFKRGRHGGSAKLPPCNKAILTIDIMDDDGKTLITIKEHNLFLHTKTEGMICQFFRSIGARKSGEKIVMDWPNVPGKSGRCKIKIDEYENKKKPGEMLKSNKIEKFLDPPEGTEAAAPENKADADLAF